MAAKIFADITRCPLRTKSSKIKNHVFRVKDLVFIVQKELIQDCMHSSKLIKQFWNRNKTNHHFEGFQDLVEDMRSQSTTIYGITLQKGAKKIVEI